ncbi:MAG: hypothetical protein ACRETO_01395 [Gammaproteobacteria bacterium]
MTARPDGHRRLTAVVALAALLACAASARADEGPVDFINDFVVYSPTVVQGQSEVELRSAGYRDSSPVLDGARGYAFSIAHSFTDWWKTELYLGQYQRAPQQPTNLVSYEFENTFQLASPGEFWADPGFLLSYGYSTHTGQANELEFGPLFQKQSGRFIQRLNLLWGKELGTGAGRQYGFRTGYSVSYAWHRGFAPGVEFFAHPSNDAYMAGPVIYGEQAFGASELEYSAGMVFGLGRKAPDTTIMLRAEYEFF